MKRIYCFTKVPHCAEILKKSVERAYYDYFNEEIEVIVKVVTSFRKKPTVSYQFST